MVSRPALRPRLIALAALALALVGAANASADAVLGPGFDLGVAAGEIRTTSAILWTRANSGAPVTLQVSTNKQFAGPLITRSLSPTAAKDDTLQPFVTGLTHGTTYYYRFLQGPAVSVTGRFKTAYGPRANKVVRFGFSGDADAQRKAGQTTPFWTTVPGDNGFGAASFGVYRQMNLEKNDFNVNMGDTIYSDSEVPGQGALASTLQEKWDKYKMNLGLAKLRNLRASTGMYNHWDDHEFVNDYTKAENGTAIYNTGKSAFLDYMPAHFTQHGGLGLYNHERWGKNLEVFRLDERSFRSAKASANHTCDNPSTGQPDVAPTAPQSNRNTFSLLIPSLSQPVSQACKDKINDPHRTMLGSKQFARFTSDIEKSTATWKVILNEVQIQQYYAFPYDRWEGYEAEREKLLHALQNAGVKNAIFITTDVHANMLNIVRYKTLESGGPVDSPYYDFSTGPVSTRTFQREVDHTTGHQGNGATTNAAFFHPPPPNGVGEKCSNINIYSYLEVTAGPNAMNLTAKDVNGHVVNDGNNNDGTPCVLTLTKK